LLHLRLTRRPGLGNVRQPPELGAYHQGGTFVVSDFAGDIEAPSTHPRWLFTHDTRLLNM
jgi:hypothetical protein